MQLVPINELGTALQQYMDPDGGTYSEEVQVFTRVCLEELARVPHVTHVLLWDDQEGGDPSLDLDSSSYDKEELLTTPPAEQGVYVGADQCAGVVWNKAGHSYYGATRYQRQWYPVGQFVLSLYFGGSPLNSAPGFYVIPVA